MTPRTATVQNTDLLTRDEPAAVLPPVVREQPEDTGLSATIERLAANPGVDVAKLEKIIDLQERILKHNARAAFDAAFARMQSELPEISERGQIKVRGEVRSTYATLEDIHAQIKPVLKLHGFAMRHRTEWPADKPGIIRIVGILSHEQGHSEESAFESKADLSDYRTEIQSMGSTVSYGRRYTTLDLLNIVTRKADDDGQAAGKTTSPATNAPAGFADWLSDLVAVADNGLAELTKTWNGSKVEFRNYLLATDRAGWDSIKAKAKAAKS